MKRHYLTLEECREYGLPDGTYFGEDYNQPDAAHLCDDPNAYRE